MNRSGRIALGLAASIPLTSHANAQLSPLLGSAGPTSSQNAPVSFLADQISYNKAGNIITATGHVHAVQNGQSLYADKVVLNRRTDVATATGHVILTQPSGVTVYANQAVLSKGMKNAIMRGVAARMAMNARLIANGARRYDGRIDELSKVVYSACDLCKKDPTAPPTWEIRAISATRDLQHKMIEFRDAEMEFDGFPVFYTPYLTEPDPSVKRQSGLLIPFAGSTSRLGVFAAIPYYYVIGPSSDVTLTPTIASKQGPALDAKYRRVFNNGRLNINVSAGQVNGTLGDAIFSNGIFDLNRSWRGGFNYDHASNPTYLYDFNVLPPAAFLTSNVFLEGFAPGAYARADVQEFQGLVASVNQSELPIVTPHLQYHFVSRQDSLGGQFTLDADMFNVLRKLGTNTRRLAAIPGYSVPFMLPLGIAGTARVKVIAATYNATRLNEQPNFSTVDGASASRVQPYGAVYLHWPLIRQGALGSQLIEPEVQLVTSPLVGISQNNVIPNEDSLDLEYSDANLFSLNRYPGIDRLEGGTRVDYAMHAAWYLPRGAFIDGLIGQSYRFHKDHNYLPASGLNGNVSDFVGHIILEPSPFFNLIYRTRLSRANLSARMIDASANFGTQLLNFSGGYLYSNTDPYVLYDSPSLISPTLSPPAGYFTPRREIIANVDTNFGPWSLSSGFQRNLQTGRFDLASFSAGWQNNCFGVNLLYEQQFTSFNLNHGATTVLLRFDFKTLGNIGFSAI